MGYFSRMALERRCYVEDHSYPDPVTLIREDIENLKNWLRWYGCEFVDREDFETICNGYISEDQIGEYVPPERIRYQSDALRELGWLYYKLKLLDEAYKEDSIEFEPDELKSDPLQITIFDYLRQKRDKENRMESAPETPVQVLISMQLPILNCLRKAA